MSTSSGDCGPLARSRRLLQVERLVAACSLLLAAACSQQPDNPPAAESPDLAASSLRCAAEPLPLLNRRAFTLGETFYLPEKLIRPDCPADTAWELASAASGSRNRIYETGAALPRFTPDVAGDYMFRLRGVPGSELTLHVVAQTPAERFRNHYLTPLYGLEKIGEELWVANGAAYTVTRVGNRAGRYEKLAEVTVGRWPAAIAGRAADPYVLVVQRGSDTLGFIDKERGVLSDALWVGDEPSGIALSADGQRAYVALATERAVAVIDVEKRAVIGRVTVGFDPRALALSKDGSRLFVASYRSANLQDGPMGMRAAGDDQDIWVVDTAKLAVVKTVYTVAADLRALALSSDETELFVAATDGDTIPTQADPMVKSFVHQAIAVSVDAAAMDYGLVRRRADLSRQASAGGKPFVNPAGVLPVGDALWVAAESSGELVTLDAATLAERKRVSVCQGPRKLVPLAGGAVAVHCYQDFSLAVVAADGTVMQTLRLTDDPRPPAVALGERVFSRPGAAYAANHSCMSCHIETQNDGMVWRFGPMIWHNVRPLQLLSATTPIEWGAYVSSTDNFGFQGPASIVARPATTVEAEGLSAFLASLIGAPRETASTRLDGSYSEAGLRGKQLFESKLPCAGCHIPPLYTSRAYIKIGKSGEPADVPSLLGVYRHGVYMVNGKPRSLEAAVDVAIAYTKAQVSAGERADLIAFLRELTPKGAAPLAIFPDIDSNEAVYPDIQPWVAFSEPVDDSLPGMTAEQEAAAHVLLETEGGQRVAGRVRVESARLTFVPDQPLRAGARYRFRVTSGLRFRSAGELEGERTTLFAVARPAVGGLDAALSLAVTLPPMGPPPLPPPVMLPLNVLSAAPGGLLPGGLLVELSLGPDQKQTLWLRIDNDQVVMQPFALPLPGRGTADAALVRGKVTQTLDVMGKKSITRIDGTLRLGAPGISVPGVAFTITPR